MKRYIQSSLTDLKLDSNTLSTLESGLYNIIKKYFHDDNYSHTQGIKITESNYDLLRYTARPYSGYRNTSSRLIMDDDSYSLNEFKSEVRKYLKQFGVTKIKFDTKKLKLHYGYVSGPDDFPVICLNAIYFNDINDSVYASLKESLGSVDDCYEDFFNVLEQFYNKLSKKSKPSPRKALSQYYGSTPLYSHVGNDLSFDSSGNPVELMVGQAYEGEKTWKSGSTIHHYSVASDIDDALKNVVDKYNGKFFNGSTSTYMVDIDGYRIRCTNKYGSSYSIFLLYAPVKLTKV